MRPFLLPLLLLAAACGADDASRLVARVAPLPASPSSYRAGDDDERVTRLPWGPLEAVWTYHLMGTRDIRIVDGRGRTVATYADLEHVDVFETVELDGTPPRELWIATSAGAHGNREDVFLRLEGDRPGPVLRVATDEGELGLEDLDGDGRPEVTGTVSRYYDADAGDFERPIVLQHTRHGWRDATRALAPGRIDRAIEEWKRAADESTTCGADVVVNVLGLSQVAGEERGARAWLRRRCADREAWREENEARIRAHVRAKVFETR